MSSAVLDRVLAIPDFDDRPQMGLSRSGLAAIVERGGLTKDGTKAKASVLERAGIKGDRKLPKPANKFEGKLRDEVATTAKYIKTRTNDPRLIQNAIDNTKAIVIDKLVPKIRAGNKKILNPLREKRAIGAYKGKDIIRRKKRAMSEGDISRNAGIASAKLESQGQLNLFNQPKRSAAIAPDTAKKVKRAISGVKGGKVVKGQNNQVPTTKVKEGKTFKSFSPKDELRNGFQNATIQVPLRDPRTGAYSLSKPMKGEKIGDFHVSGSKDQGYSVTHIPTGFKVVDTIDMKNSMGDNDINTARRLAKTFDKAKISNVLPKSTARANKIATNRRLMSGMKPAQQKIKAAIAEAKESAAKEMLGKSGEKDRLGRLIYDRKGNEIIYES